ncbi:MAG: hypothetical protein JW891_14715 [Candidatus Lokiarchaeota archaeon]|nr:hypothetical protein [Candidatus Lokiarchaeota archaeon]
MQEVGISSNKARLFNFEPTNSYEIVQPLFNKSFLEPRSSAVDQVPMRF